MIKRLFRYGIDAPVFSIGYFTSGIVITILSFIGLLPHWTAGGLMCVFFGICMLFSSLFGKSITLDKILNTFIPKNVELNALDIGTGRGLVLSKIAHIKNVKKATGIDLWINTDQSNNNLRNTTKNMEYEGIINNVTIDTGDMRNLPYKDNSFNLITASFSIHNVGKNDIKKVCQEIYRVAENGAVIIILDIKYISAYKAYFESENCQIIYKSLPTPLTFPLARTLVVKVNTD